MKIHVFFRIIILFLLVSCSGKESKVVEKKENKVDGELLNASSIVIASNKKNVNTGEVVEFTSQVTFGDGSVKDKTSNTVFFVDNSEIKGSKYIATKSGTVKVKGAYSTTKNTVKSEDVLLKVAKKSLPASFTKKVVVEDYTGSWCGVCPRVTYALELIRKKTKKVFAVGIHFRDAMANNFSNELVKINDILGFPTVYINRNMMWQIPQENSLEVVMNEAVGNVNVGLSITSVLSNKNLQIAIGTGIAQSQGEGLKLVVFVLENGIIAEQANYTPYYGTQGVPIKNFVHDDVLRYSATNVLGDPIANTKGLHYKTFNVNLNEGITIKNFKKIGVLAMLINKTTGGVVNAQYAKVNTIQKFD